MGMDILGVGPLEILFVFIIAFIVFGPRRLVDISKNAGKIMRNLSKTASQVNDKINKEFKDIDTTPSAGSSSHDHKPDWYISTFDDG